MQAHRHFSNVCYSDQSGPIDPEAKKQYDREFLLGFQFISASMHKPEGLPVISDVVLDELNKAENAWKPSTIKPEDSNPEEPDTEQAKTQEVFKRLRSILNKLTPQKFQELMKQVMELKIDTEERLKGAIDLIFEKAISEPNFSVAYANMCRCLIGVSYVVLLHIATALMMTRVLCHVSGPLNKANTNNWVPRRGEQGPKTIDQIHKEAEMEEHREQIKVQQQLLSKKESRGPHTPARGRAAQPQDEGWNTVPISKNRPIDITRLSKITKPGALDFNNQRLAPDGKGMWGSWGKGSSGGSGAKPASGDQGKPLVAMNTLNLRDRFDRFARSDRRDGNQFSKRSFSRESQERGGRGGDSRASTEPVRREALQCVAELNSASLLYVFARTGLESTLERSTIARERMGLLLHQLVEAGTLPIEQYYKGLLEILEVAEDMAIDIPHIWLYLAELITPMLHDGGIPMGQLFR
ncbi:hypothetical protein GOODEAATRI_005807 [Goodea atripinnis]|uniref:MI domain-containing protein n=1 Tax=Goodea atripinnis TaxID=208336 RepID=A0ABV0PL78_9TELE